MSLALAVTALQKSPDLLEKLEKSLTPDLVERALAQTGVASIRKRKLPAEQVIWLLVGMSLFTNTPIHKVIDRLDLVLNGSVVSSAVSQARKRLGPAPLSWLFRRLAEVWTQKHKNSLYQGLQLFGIDGTVMNVQDTADNTDHFGRPGSRKELSGYPQARVIALMELGLRTLRDAEITPLSEGESVSAAKLVTSLPADSLVLMDRGFVSYRLFAASQSKSANTHFLVRVRKNTKIRVDEVLPDGSKIGTIVPSSISDKEDSNLPSEMRVRLVEFMVKGSQNATRLLTTLLDYRQHSARKLAELYHMRWELEVGFDELKTELLLRKECLRSKCPKGVYQELWATLMTYNLIRREMALLAQSHGASPACISFKTAVLFICDFFLVHSSDSSTGKLPEKLRRLREDLWRHRNPARRAERSNPRQVKIKMSGYARKAGIHRQRPREA